MRKKKRSAIPRILHWAAYGFFLGFLLLVATAVGWFQRSPLMMSMVRNGLRPVSPKQAFRSNALTVLLLGCDEDREYAGYRQSKVLRKYARADMILVAKLDFDKRTISGVSIPRDTECKLPGYRRMKINAYHAIGKNGEQNELIKEAVEHTLPGIAIDRVLVINYDAFQKLVDSVGGVDVKVSQPMHYDDFAGNLHVHLEPGRHRLNGKDAMGYVRYRKDVESDFGRQNRQKEFLSSFKTAVWRDPFRLPEVAEIGRGVLNGAMTNDEIASLAFFARGLATDGIKLGMVPVLPGRGSYLRVDKDKLATVLKEFRLIEDAAPADLRVQR